MTTSPSRSTGMSRTLYNELSGLEARLGQKVDDALKEMKELYKENKRANEDVARDLDRHEALEGHPIALQRIHSLEVWKDGEITKEQTQLTQASQQAAARPMQTWQIVVNIAFLTIALLSLFLAALPHIHIQ